MTLAISSPDKTSKDLTTLYFLYNPGKTQSKQIYIKNVIPDSVSYSYSPNFNSQSTLGRLSPIQIYSGGSATRYTFSLTVHEDMVSANSNYSQIDTFVDALKSLAYPLSTEEGIVRPSVYFQIGEISGSGLVEISVSWSKPFRNGRYIVAEISFNITVERIFPQVSQEIIRVRADTVLSEYIEYNNIVVYSSEGLPNFSEVAPNHFYKPYNTNYTTATSDLIDIDNTKASREASERRAQNYFDMAEITMKMLLENLNNFDLANEDVSTFSKSINLLGKISFNSTTIGSGKESVNTLEYFTNLRSQFTDFLDYYYYNVDRDMTRPEYDKIKEDIEAIITNMESLYKEVYSYGASN